MRTIAGAMVLLVALPLTAEAQPGMTPYAAPPPAATAPPPAEPKMRLELGVIAAGPRGDWDQLNADTSPGFGLQLGFTVSPGVSLFGGLRFVRVKYQDDSMGFEDELEISHREMQLGLRLQTNVAPAAKLFVEGNVHSATIAASFQGESQSESGVGLGARGGLVFMADRKIGIGVAVAYSAADITAEETEEGFEDAWLSGDAFVSFWF